MSNQKRILIVDDESDMVKYLSALFQDNGYDTISAFDGAKGFEMAKDNKPDLITLDITMPEQSGVRTYRMYKDDPEIKDIPVVIITAIGDNMKSFLKKLGGFSKPEGFMSKPIDPDELLNMVSELL